MTSLARLLELVRRTQLPMIVQSSEMDEPCVLLPLAVYERLAGSSLVLTPEQIPTPSNLGDASRSSVSSQPGQEVVERSSEGLRLQDLLQLQGSDAYPATLSSLFPQPESIEDRFAFDGLDVRIVPNLKQKNLSRLDTLDES